MEINRHIFKEYDIRGIVEKDFSENLVKSIAKAYVTWIKKQPTYVNKEIKISVGRDVRLSSQTLYEWLIAGLKEMGVEIIDLGCCPTPLVYFSLFQIEPDGGIMITGSHNPKEYNGFKLCFNKTTLYGQQIQEIRELVEKGNFFTKSGWKKRSCDIITLYKQFQLKRHANLATGKYPLKVVIDAGNGTAGLVAPHLFRELNCEVIELFCEPDGNFPNHHPDPTIPENLKKLQEVVVETKSDVGFAFDGDADRIGVIAEDGSILWGDEIMIILARDLLKRRPNAKIIGEVKCSSKMFKEIEKSGGIPIMWKTGHSLIKSKMKEEHALLAGEMSGHIFFAEEYFGYDDAIHASLEIASVLHKYKQQNPDVKLSSLLEGMPKSFVTPEIRLEFPDEYKFKVVEILKNMLITHKDKRVEPNIVDINQIDGIRVEFEHGWGLIRPSNTQPVIVMRFEAEEKVYLDIYKSFLENCLSEAKSVLGIK